MSDYHKAVCNILFLGQKGKAGRDQEKEGGQREARGKWGREGGRERGRKTAKYHYSIFQERKFSLEKLREVKKFA